MCFPAFSGKTKPVREGYPGTAKTADEGVLGGQSGNVVRDEPDPRSKLTKTNPPQRLGTNNEQTVKAQQSMVCGQ